MSEDHKARIRAFIDRVLTGGAIDVTGEYSHADVVEEVPFPGQGPGFEDLTETLTQMRRAFPDMAWRVEEPLAEDTRVLTRFRWSGTHRGEFLGIPATRRVARVWGMVISSWAWVPMPRRRGPTRTRRAHKGLEPMASSLGPRVAPVFSSRGTRVPHPRSVVSQMNQHRCLPRRGCQEGSL